MLLTQDISAATSAFPARVAGTLLPRYADVPDEFKRHGNQWARLVSSWFFRGLDGAVFTPADGINLDKALRHIGACMRSFEPKHEHKEAGCAYLLSLWFKRVEHGGDVYGEPLPTKAKKSRKKGRA